jgi:hypothetical protein
MANTYTLISSNTVTSAVASVSFDSIPATYTDLLVKINARNTDTGGGSMTTQFNNDTTSANYDVLRVLGTSGGTRTSSRYTGSAGAAFISSNDFTANTFGSTDIYISNYTSSTTYKATSIDSIGENNATEAYLTLSSGLWKSNSAITSIQFGAGGAFNFVTGSTFYLYGIKNS